MRAQDYSDAIKEFTEALWVDSDLASVHYNLGLTYGKLGNYEEAIKEHKEALRIKPDLVEAHAELGLMSYDTKQN